MKNELYKFNKILNVIDELFYPIAYTYSAEDINYNHITLLTLFAHYNEQDDIDYFYNVPIDNEDLHENINLRKLYEKNIDKAFFTAGSPEKLKYFTSVNLPYLHIKDILPDADQYAVL